MLSQKRRMAGFTLMELLIVIIIIGLLATLALPQFPRALERARQAEARAQLGQIYQAERIYYSEHNTYTAALGSLMASTPPANSAENYFVYTVASTGSTFFTATATRKDAAATTTGGRAPAWTLVYTITLDQTGTYTVGAI